MPQGHPNVQVRHKGAQAESLGTGRDAYTTLNIYKQLVITKALKGDTNVGSQDLQNQVALLTKSERVNCNYFLRNNFWNWHAYPWVRDSML